MLGWTYTGSHFHQVLAAKWLNHIIQYQEAVMIPFFSFISLQFYILNVIIPVMLDSPRTCHPVWQELWELEKPGGHFTVTIPSNVSLFLLAA